MGPFLIYQVFYKNQMGVQQNYSSLYLYNLDRCQPKYSIEENYLAVLYTAANTGI